MVERVGLSCAKVISYLSYQIMKHPATLLKLVMDGVVCSALVISACHAPLKNTTQAIQCGGDMFSPWHQMRPLHGLLMYIVFTLLMEVFGLSVTAFPDIHTMKRRECMPRIPEALDQLEKSHQPQAHEPLGQTCPPQPIV